MLALAGCVAWGTFEYTALPDARELANRNPQTTALMDARNTEALAQGRKPNPQQVWVPLSSVAQSAVDAVLISEDASFYVHQGIDFDELKKVLTQAWETRTLQRGASTITMQLAKNLWLTNDRSLLRKLKELLLARRLEDALPKKRILTLYLNVAEWGDGIYGIEAASRAHHGVSARQLTVAQGAILAAMLPSPRKWTPARRPRVLRIRALRTIDQLEQYGRITADQAQLARDEVQTTLAGPLDRATEPPDETSDDET